MEGGREGGVLDTVVNQQRTGESGLTLQEGLLHRLHESLQVVLHIVHYYVYPVHVTTDN